jgi:hypothetical protein
MTETRQRSHLRTASYRLIAWAFTVFWTNLFVEDWAGAIVFSTILHLLLSIFYYANERIWGKIQWGKLDKV